MELLLIGVTVVSLLLAVTMSVVAWRLLHGERERSAARVDALEALAFESHPAAEARPAARTTAPAPAPAATAPALEDFGDEPDGLPPSHAPLDLALRAPRSDEAPIDRPFRSPGRTSQDLVNDHMFSASPQAAAAGRRWLIVAAIALVIVAAAVTVSALRTPEITAAVAASRGASPSRAGAAGAHPLELLSLRHSVDADGAFTVTGLVQNPVGGATLRKVTAVVYLFDESGGFFSDGHAAIDVPSLEAGDESPFVVKIPNAGAVSRYRVGFRQDD